MLSLVLLTAVVAQDPASQPSTRDLVLGLKDPVRRAASMRALRRLELTAVAPLLLATLETKDPTLAVPALQLLEDTGTDDIELIGQLANQIPDCPPALADALLGAVARLGAYIPGGLQNRRIVDLTIPMMRLASAVGADALRPIATEHRQGLLNRAQIDAGEPVERLLQMVPARATLDARTEFAIELLGRHGDQATAALPRISTILASGRTQRSSGTMATGNNQITFQVGPRNLRQPALALLRIDRRHPSAPLAWAVLLEHGRADEREDAIAALREAGAAAAPCVPALRRLLAMEPPPELPRLRAEVATILGTIGPAAKDAAPDLDKLIYGTDAHLAAVARAALRSIREK
jgi:hypothetical protein